MPGNPSLMAKFVKEYGKRGKSIYYAKAVKSAKFAKAAGEMSVHNRANK